MPSEPDLPPSVRVIVRGWLNCNQILLIADGGSVLIDSGYGRDSRTTLNLVEGADYLGGRRLDRLINTHCHSDHMGGNALLRQVHNCRITIPAGEARHVLPWTDQSCWAEMTGQSAQRFEFDDTIAPGNAFQGGGLNWQAIAAPGHDMDALMFWNERDRLLITGDALWENGMGFVWPDTRNAERSHIAAALDTLDRIERLDPRAIIPGHGAPFSGVAAALARARGRLDAFAKSPEKNARHVVKVMFVFTLLDRGRMQADELSGYLASVPIYREMNNAFLSGDFDRLASRTLSELVASSAVKVEQGWIVPCMTA